MRTNWLGAILKYRVVILLAVLGLCRPALSQEVSVALLHPDMIEPTPMAPAPVVKTFQPATFPEAPSHRFWDRENCVLFATSAAFSAADFVVTKDNLRGGGQELNPVTRVFTGSTAGLAVNFAGETAGVVGLSSRNLRPGPSIGCISSNSSCRPVPRVLLFASTQNPKQQECHSQSD
jgi:hypothetical protein